MNYILVLGLTLLFFYFSENYISNSLENPLFVLISGGLAIIFLNTLTDLLKKIKAIPYTSYILIPLCLGMYLSYNDIRFSFEIFTFLKYFFLSCLSLYISTHTVLKFSWDEFIPESINLGFRFIAFLLFFWYLGFVFYNVPLFAEIEKLSLREYAILGLVGILPAPLISNIFLRDKRRTIEGLHLFSLSHISILVVLLFCFFIGIQRLDLVLHLVKLICISAAYFIVFRFHKKWINSEFMLFFMGTFLLLNFSGVLQSAFEYFFIFFLFGIFTQKERPLNAQIKLYGKRYTRISLLLFSLLFFIDLNIEFGSFTLIFIIFFTNLALAYLGRKLIIKLFKKTSVQAVRVTGLQGFLALFMLEFFFANRIIDQTNYSFFIFLVVSQLILGSWVLQIIWTLYVSDQINETKLVHEIENEPIYFKALPKALDDPLLRNRVALFTSQWKDLSEDFVRSVLSIIVEPWNQFLKELFEKFDKIEEKLTKELQYIGHRDSEILKEKVRENRAYLATEYYKLVKNDLSISALIPELLTINRDYLSNVQDVLKNLKDIELYQNEYNLNYQSDDGIVVQIIKFIKRLYVSTIQFAFSNFRLKRRVGLKDILLYHFYNKFPFIDKLFLNKVLYQNFISLNKSYVLFKEMDGYFLRLLEFIETNTGEEIFTEQLGHFSSVLKSDVAAEYEIIQSDFNRFIEYDSEILKRGINSVLSNAYDDFLIAGTFEEFREKRRPSKTFVYYDSHFSEMQGLTTNWTQLNISKVGHLSMELEIIKLQSKMRKIVKGTIDHLTEEIDSHILTHLTKTSLYRSELVQEGFQHVQEGVEADEKFIRDLKKRFIYDLKINTQKSIEFLKHGRKLSGFISDLIEKIHRLTLDVPASFKLGYSVYNDIKDGDYPKMIPLQTAQFREITRSFLEIEVTRSLTELNGQITVGLDNLIQVCNEVSTEFNIQIDRLLGEDSFFEKPNNERISDLKRVFEGLDKQFSDSIEYTNSMVESIESIIIREIVGKIHKIRSLTIEKADESIKHLSEKSLEDFTTTESLRFQFYNFLDTYSEYFSSLFYKNFRRFRAFKEKISTINGDTEVISMDSVGIQKSTEKLPYVYQRLLSLEPIEIKDFLKGRDDYIQQLTGYIAEWRNGSRQHIAIYGELGNGKTSFMNYLVKYVLSREVVYRIKLRPGMTERTISELISASLGLQKSVDNFDNLFQYLNSKSQHIIIVLDSVQFLVEKSIHGIVLYQRIMGYMVQTLDHILWIHSYSGVSWDYLENLYQVHTYYTHTINLHSMSYDEMKSVIESRNKVSGLTFNFPKTVGLSLLDTVFSREKSDDVHIEQFYKTLYRITKGNIFTVLFYWVLSVEKIEGSTVHIKPTPKIDFTAIQELDNESLLLIFCCLQQGYITRTNVQDAMQVEPMEASRLLDKLVHLHLLEKDHDWYTVNRVFYVALKNELKQRKFIYG